MITSTFLAPYGATFSHEAYNLLAARYKIPKASAESYIPARDNNDIPHLLITKGGYGTVAMETSAEARNEGPIEAFIALLRTYPTNDICPLNIIGAVRMPVHFCVMRRIGYRNAPIKRVLAHPKALGACHLRLAAMNVDTISATSNGEAARLVAEVDTHESAAALGPISAAEVYNLEVVHEAFEDHSAVTTFFLIGPKVHTSVVSSTNRALLLFEVSHQPNALAEALAVIGQAGLNLIHVHNVHVGDREYHFAAEVVVPQGKLDAFADAAQALQSITTKLLTFGPFEEYEA